MAQVVAVAIGQLTAEPTHCHRRLRHLGIQALPGKILPVETAVQAEPLAPVQLATEAQLLLGTGTQVQGGNLGAVGLEQPVQGQHQWPACGRQLGVAADPVAVGQIAAGRQLYLVQAQGIRQLAVGLEAIGMQLQAGREIIRQRLHLAVQASGEVAGAIGRDLQALLHITDNL
ncbi:hypothetical protein D3C86_1593990 [compost metagenome]